MFGTDLFDFNSQRNCSYLYGYEAVSQFLHHNNLLSVIRAHEVQDEGFFLFPNGKDTDFPTVIVVFSAPNYCDSYENLGAFITFVNNEMNIRQFKWVEHPYYLPKFMNVFQWSIPYLSEKVTDIFKVLVQVCQKEDVVLAGEDLEVGGVVKTKLLTLARMSRMYTTLRKEQETIVALKGLTGGIIPQGLLSQGPGAIREALKNFQEIKKIDSINELRPIAPGEDAPVHKSDSFKGVMQFNPIDKESPIIKIISKERLEELPMVEESE